MLKWIYGTLTYRSSVSPESGIDTTGGTNSDFDQADFEDDYYQTFPVLGVAKALYHFDGKLIFMLFIQSHERRISIMWPSLTI